MSLAVRRPTPSLNRNRTMSDIIEALLLRNLQEVFGEGDPARRHRGSLHRGLRRSPAYWPPCRAPGARPDRRRIARRSSDLRLHAAYRPPGGPGRWSHRLGLRAGQGAAQVHGPRRHHRPRWQDRHPLRLSELAAGLRRIQATHAISRRACPGDRASGPPVVGRLGARRGVRAVYSPEERSPCFGLG